MYLCIAFRKCNWIVSWCNGSTTVFGSVCRGSNPRETTQKILRQKVGGFFVYGRMESFSGFAENVSETEGVFSPMRKVLQSDRDRTGVLLGQDWSFVRTGLVFHSPRIRLGSA